VFGYTYYSDATLMTEVGHNFQTCDFSGQIHNNFSGTQTAYYTRQLTGYCSLGGGDPFQAVAVRRRVKL